MNLLGEPLVELLHMAPTPLYSSYCWLAREFDDELSMRQFFELIDGMLAAEVVRLWHTDRETRENTRLHAVPSDMEERYRELEDELDPRYDPYGYTLDIGRAASPSEEPAWEVDVDFRAGTFVLIARREFEQEEVERAFAVFAPKRFDEVRRTETEAGLRIEGIVADG